jgi:hypothetical protein
LVIHFLHPQNQSEHQTNYTNNNTNNKYTNMPRKEEYDEDGEEEFENEPDNSPNSPNDETAVDYGRAEPNREREEQPEQAGNYGQAADPERRSCSFS